MSRKSVRKWVKKCITIFLVLSNAVTLMVCVLGKTNKHPEFIPFTLRNPDLLNSMKIDLSIIFIAHGNLDHACISVIFGNVL